jgi:hypothetical protein
MWIGRTGLTFCIEEDAINALSLVSARREIACRAHGLAEGRGSAADGRRLMPVRRATSANAQHAAEWRTICARSTLLLHPVAIE